MKIVSQIVAVCVFQAWGVSGFSARVPAGMMPPPSAPMSVNQPIPITSATAPSDPEKLPFDIIPMQRIEGGDTLRTFKMPADQERCLMVFETYGRPMKVHVEMWQGPIRKTHNLVIRCQDGAQTPYRAMLKFRAGGQVLKVSADGNYEYPLLVGVGAPSVERSKALGKITERVFDESPKQIIQGSEPDSTKHGAVQTFPVAADVDSVQLVMWSRDYGRRSCKCLIEVLHGPNNKRQEYDLHVSGGSQPYHAVFETPGEGWIIRMRNKNFREFPFQAAIVPYEVGDKPQSDPGMFTIN